MSNLNKFSNRYRSYISTFKITSFDSENSYFLCKDETQKVIDFDKILEDNTQIATKDLNLLMQFIYMKIIYIV